jgi:hypothetical protein
MTINVDNLINCVFLSSDRDNSKSSQNYQSYMISRYSSSNQSLMLDSKSFSMSFQNMSSSNMLFAFLNNEVVVRLSLNVFIVTRKIIYTRKNASSSMKILKLKEFTCKKKEFISIFIILKFFTFEWFSTKVSDNALKTQRSQFIRIASSQLRSKFIRFVWKRTRKFNSLLMKRRKKSFSWITNFTQTSTSFWLQRDLSLKFLRNLLNIINL